MIISMHTTNILVKWPSPTLNTINDPRASLKLKTLSLNEV